MDIIICEGEYTDNDTADKKLLYNQKSISDAAPAMTSSENPNI